MKLHNSFTKTAVDLQFRRGETAHDRFYGDRIVGPNWDLRPCETGPFYVLPVFPGNVNTVFGLETNEDPQVLNESGGGGFGTLFCGVWSELGV